MSHKSKKKLPHVEIAGIIKWHIQRDGLSHGLEALSVVGFVLNCTPFSSYFCDVYNTNVMKSDFRSNVH